MISEEGKRALNSYELANVYNLQAFLSYSKRTIGLICVTTNR